MKRRRRSYDQHHRITPAPRRLLRLKQVLDRTGLPKSALYSRISAGTFPRQIPLGASVRWLESEVEEWIQLQVDASDQQARNGGIAGGTVGASPPLPLAA
ncbi:AlpA family phage regulatory protein [uncultured Stenotrophomonas sp.]|uniref:helix-turn-helix transcriptional regulator n=1 Tax=uncultured Stenotrophomonas sp. TaxID=165438 RepID=UPI0028D332A2|nr:AlpA family phage regulatory protein [uncultured Stenotrophomonas sp.]